MFNILIWRVKMRIAICDSNAKELKELKISLYTYCNLRKMDYIIEEFLSGEISIEVKDGELLPETYSFMYGDSKDSIIIQAQEAMKNALDSAWNNRNNTTFKTLELVLFLVLELHQITVLSSHLPKL